MPTGIIGAMAEEVGGLLAQLTQTRTHEYAHLVFYEGMLGRKPVVIVQSGVGKVNAAMCTQLLIDQFHVKAVINTGVAGGIDPLIEIGDVVISTTALQHDVNVSVFGYDSAVIPSLTCSNFPADDHLQHLAEEKAKHLLGPRRVHQGLVATGDQFITDPQKRQYLFAAFSAACVEMEGAAIAQVAYLNQIPFVIIRIISDKADTNASQDFSRFVVQVVPQLNQLVTAIIADYSVCSP